MSLTKKQIKLIQSLSAKRTRDELGLFVAEGDKAVGDLLHLFPCRLLVATADFLSAMESDSRNVSHPVSVSEVVEAAHDDICRASALNAPQRAIGIFAKPEVQLSMSDIQSGLTLMLDHIQDPGNLGTIVRIADWFGIDRIVCSPDTVDVFNGKTVQATMGAIGRVKIVYSDLVSLLSQLNGTLPVFGTYLEGDCIYDAELPSDAVIVMGNEGKGISETLARYINRKLFIPNFPQGVATSESLNVAVATAITCSEFRRRVTK